MQLRKYPDKILIQKCTEVAKNDCHAKWILNAMSEKMYEWEGVGLAAPQVGISKRLVVIDIRGDDSLLFKMINPEIIYRSDNLIESEEGCLSVPNIRETIYRNEEIIVKYYDENFEEREVKANGLLARCLQHELDHLDGKLYFDRLSRLKRSRLIKKYKNEQLLNEQYEKN